MFTFTGTTGPSNVTEISETIGGSKIKATEFLIVKNENLYKIRYIREPTQSSSSLATLVYMVNSFRIFDDTATTNISSSVPEDHNGTNSKSERFKTFTNATKGIDIKYPSNWGS